MNEGDFEGVEHPYQQCPGIVVGGRVFDELLADLERGFLVQEAEAGGDRLPFEVGLGVGEQVVADPSDAQQGDGLKGDRPFVRVAPEGDC